MTPLFCSLYIGWQWRNVDPAGFRSHLVGKTLEKCFSLWSLWNTFCWQASDRTDIFINQRIEFCLNNTKKSSLLKSTHYIVLYPQNGDRIVTVDSVTSYFLPIWWVSPRASGYHIFERFTAETCSRDVILELRRVRWELSLLWSGLAVHGRK